MLQILDLLSLVLELSGIAPSGGLAGEGPRWVRKRIAESWPTAQATVSSGRIERSSPCYVLRAPYSFYAAGERYGGQYQRTFWRAARAEETRQRLLQSPPLVRYNPSDPDTSILDDG